MNKIKELRSKHSNEFTLALILIGLFVLMSILSPDRFLTVNNIKTMAFQMLLSKKFRDGAISQWLVFM